VRHSTASASGAADTENLHTDVMRFMAILGLCLAAIFALVQSVPVRGTNGLPQRPSQDAAQPDATLELERLGELQVEVSRLTEQIRKTREQNDSAEQALAVTRKQLRTATDDAGQAHKERDRIASELQDLARRLQRKRSDLSGIQQTLQQKSDSLAALERQLGEEQAKLGRVQVELKALRSQQQPVLRRKPIEPTQPPVSRPTRRGFTLRFASSGVLAHLVTARAVSLYGMLDSKAWRLSLPGGLPAFTPHALPDQYHEMNPATVPPAYVQALAGTPGVPEASAVVWGVRLPPETKRAIADLTRNLQGGDLVIGANGKLYLNEGSSTAHRRER
jgi:hypothetical protein